MQIFTTHANLPPDAKGAVVAMGNFDGVHLGHVGVIEAARAMAQRLNAPLGVLTFEPHPRRVFRPADPPFRLTRPETKVKLLAALGLDLLYVLPFSREFSLRSADEFARDVLVEGIGIKGAIAGANFLYGHNRAGTLTQLRAEGQALGFEVAEAPTLTDERGEPYSSTRIRQALSDARPDEAAHLLGRPWAIETMVERGDQRGRELGYPTANGRLGDLLHPAYGIYAVRATVGTNPAVLHGVANIGIRPMWKSDQPLLETFIFDFDQDIYGQSMRVELVDFLRPEEKFDSIEALKVQMAKDCQVAREKLQTLIG
jgi:riboflavin kinase/FMN adenylyltransferase